MSVHNEIRLTRRVSAYEISKSTGFHVDFGFQIGFLDFKVISGFHVDFRISKWISTFWISFEELLFVILKILVINKPSQPGCPQNTMSQALHSSPRRTAYCVHNVLLGECRTLWGERERTVTKSNLSSYSG